MSEDLKNKLSKEKNLTSAEADRVLDKAAELMLAAEGQGHLSKEDLKAGAAEVGIDPRYVEEAMLAVRREEAEQTATAARNKKRAVLAAVIVGALFVSTGAVARLSLGGKMAEVEQRRAQLDNVIERRNELLPQLAEARKNNTGPESALVIVRLMDEMSGSQNRIATEKKRYNDAVVTYESAAKTPPISWLRPLTGMPAKVPARAGQ